MCGGTVREIGTGASEWIDRMVSRTSSTTELIAKSWAGGGDRLMRAETGVNNELVEIRKFMVSDGGWFGAKVQG